MIEVTKEKEAHYMQHLAEQTNNDLFRNNSDNLKELFRWKVSRPSFVNRIDQKPQVQTRRRDCSVKREIKRIWPT